MAFFEPRTAAEVAEHLRGTNEWMRLRRRLFRNMETWKSDEIREVIGAAEQNTSVWSLVADVNELKDRAAGLVPLILRRLKHLQTIHVSDSSGSAASSTVDIVLRRLMADSSSEDKVEVTRLVLDTCSCGPITFLDFCEFHRHSLVHLHIVGQCAANPEFVAAVACGWGRLQALRRVSVTVAPANTFASHLLSALHTSSTVNTVDVVLDEHAQAALGDVGLFCRCTKTVKCARFFYEPSQGSPSVNMNALFDIGNFHPFSEKIKDVQFFACENLDEDGSLIEHAATALSHVEFLRFGSCRFPAIYAYSSDYRDSRSCPVWHDGHSTFTPFARSTVTTTS
jgi:hypothetical protein